jgi:restriction endonuclease
MKKYKINIIIILENTLKISQLDLIVSDDYNDFAEKLIKDIEEQFFGKSYNSIILSKFINYLRKEFYLYAKLKFNKDVNVKVLIPRVPKGIIEFSISGHSEI